MSEPVPYRGLKRTRKGRPALGQMSPNREAWVDMPKFQAVLFVGNDPEWVEWKEEQGDPVPDNPDTPPVVIQLRIAGRRYPTQISLSGMTAPELRAFKGFMDLAFEKAQPSCELQDQRALEAFQEGDDSFARIYRPIPHLFVRERIQQEHSESLQGRPARHLLEAEVRRRGVLDAIAGASDGELPSGEPDEVGDENPQP